MKHSDTNKFRPPAPSLGSRRPPLRSAGSARAAIVDPRANRVLYAESFLETKMTLVFLMRPDVLEVVEQQPVVSYVDGNGNKRTHTFDLLVTFVDGHKVAYTIKPLAKALKYALHSELNCIAQHVPKSVADAVALLTENSITPWQFSNAVLLHSAARDLHRYADTDAIVRATITKPQQTIGDIVQHTGLQGRAFRAVLRLIVRGELKVITQGLLTYATIVAPATLNTEDAR